MEKENEEIKTIKETDPTILDKPIHKIPIKPKEKEMAKGSKEKAREKASPDTATGRKNTMNGTSKTTGQNQSLTICKKFTLKKQIALETTRRRSYSLRTLRELSKPKQKKTMKISMKLLSTITTRQTNMKDSLWNLHRTSVKS